MGVIPIVNENDTLAVSVSDARSSNKPGLIDLTSGSLTGN